MAKFSDVNTIPATGGETMYRIKEVLKAAGWVVNQSSDGTTYNAAGDQITHGGAGANGMANANAWFEIQEPETNGRSYTIQRDTANNTDWRIKMSAAAGFSGGTPGATQTPSATDEAIMFGGGTDAAPTHSVLFFFDGTYRLHAVAESTPVGPVGNRCYGFWTFCTETGTGTLGSNFCQYPMAVGSYPPLTGTRLAPTDGEADPCAYMVSADVDSFDIASVALGGWSNQTPSNNSVRAWYNYGYGGQTFYFWQALNFEIQTNFADSFVKQMGTGQHGYDTGLPVVICTDSRFPVQVGLKGVCERIKVTGTNRNYPDTINLSTDAYVYANTFLYPYEDGTAPLL